MLELSMALAMLLGDKERYSKCQDSRCEQIL